MKIIILLFLGFRGSRSSQGGSPQASDASVRPPEEVLLEKLFKNYDADARGIFNYSSPIIVQIHFVLLQIYSLKEISQVLTTAGIIILEWQDDRLKWNQEEYGGIEDVVVSSRRVWLPEIALLNGADDLLPDFQDFRVLVYHTGRVKWEPGAIFKTTCAIDITYFPFDEQRCPILIGAWAYTVGRTNLTILDNKDNYKGTKPNGEWDLLDVKSEWREEALPCCPDGPAYAKFTFHLRRRRTFYVLNIVLPCAFLSVLASFVFLLPPESGEKISLGISVLLAFVVFLVRISDIIPTTSLTTPVIVVYLTFTMILGTISVCLTVFVLNFYHRESTQSVPRCLKLMVLRGLANCMGMTKCCHKRTTVRIQTPEKPGSRVKRSQVLLNQAPIAEQEDEWKEVARVLDRFFFIATSMSTLISATLIAFILACEL